MGFEACDGFQPKEIQCKEWPKKMKSKGKINKVKRKFTFGKYYRWSQTMEALNATLGSKWIPGYVP